MRVSLNAEKDLVGAEQLVCFHGLLLDVLLIVWREELVARSLDAWAGNGAATIVSCRASAGKACRLSFG